MTAVVREGKIRLLKRVCHPELLKVIPLDQVTDFKISYTSNGVESQCGVSENIRWTTVTMEVSGVQFRGKARCSTHDNFSRDTGRRLAFKRAARDYLDFIKPKEKGMAI